MSTYKILDCGIHDHLELACIRSYPLSLELKDQKSVTGTPLNIETRQDKSEYLILQQELETISIRLDQIIAFTPLTQNASFGRIIVK
ncbi:transcriptional antiterminator, Rof [Shewanella psychrophila]|uniref:Transcriptional antiterminator, Rof n=1 Tax=Shewanella psychrophila TaxID=225848 RepID=A0A1S6HSB5_9GAMM|nr:Rho-binding antiterminator [Shewanella psychrophila]AQS38374.1 transcriptional antiterminator, Rof [Shewanella psychrophila]